MSFRGKTAIVGIGETEHKRSWPNRSALGLAAEAAAEAINDAGLRREDIDGLISISMSFLPQRVAEYVGLRPTGFAAGVGMNGATPGVAITIAAALLDEGVCNYILFVNGNARDPENPGSFTGAPGEAGGSTRPDFISEFVSPYGPAIAANTNYALLYTRHMYKYGTKPEQLARISVNQRFNAGPNPLAAMRDPITVDDVLNSRYVNYPLHILECVMPCAGGIAFIMTTAERARLLRRPPVYVLGAAVAQGFDNSWLTPDICQTATAFSAPAAYRMAGYGPKDFQFAEFYDCYTILHATTLEDAGICPKGEIGPFFESTDTTFKGSFPINTDGGQLSCGQFIAGSSGTQHVTEAVRQIRGMAGERQVARHDLCVVNVNGGSPSQEATMVLGSANAL
jgi:acetyl-CoA acetyltransferase